MLVAGAARVRSVCVGGGGGSYEYWQREPAEPSGQSLVMIRTVGSCVGGAQNAHALDIKPKTIVPTCMRAILVLWSVGEE